VSLTFFPTPYPDESLYSVCARYHNRSGNVSPKWTLEELFGVSTIIPSLHFPSSLETFCSRIPPLQMDVMGWIQNHTLAPIYLPVMPESRVRTLLRLMRTGKGTGIHALIGASAGGAATHKGLIYCPDCFREDVDKYGEPYWHRIHQASGVFVCPLHAKPLLRLLDPQADRHGFTLLPLSKEWIKSESVLHDGLSPKTMGFLYNLAEDMNLLLNCSNVPNLYRSKQVMMSKLVEQGYATVSGRIRQDLLGEKFVTFFGPELLECLESLPKSEHSWLTFATRKERRAINPIRQLLLIRFLYGSLQEFLNQYPKTDHSLFGKGPWPCLNKASEHYGEHVITSCRVTRCSDTGRPVGTFACDCGFVYSRRGPDRTETDRMRIGRIRSFGEIWHNRLQQLVAEGRSYRSIAKMLNVDTNTVIKYANSRTETRSNFEIAVATCVLKKGNANESRGQSNRKKYNWVLRNPRVNWELRDLELSILVEQECQRLLKTNSDKPIRIRLTTVAKRIGKLSLLLQHQDKLPITMRKFQLFEESVEEFQIRRVRWAVHQLSKEFPIKRWQIEKLAGLRPGYSETVRQEIEKYITSSDYGVLRGNEVNSDWLH